jgi:hypothetical protein
MKRQAWTGRLDASAIPVKRKRLAQLFFLARVASTFRFQKPDHGVDCEKCSRARATPMRTITLARKPAKKQNPAA